MSETMRIWDAVSKTNPAHTKKVTQRGGFTSICAQSQIMEATRQFGPIGIGWGYEADEPIFHDKLVFVRVTLWHGNRENRFGPVTGGAEWVGNNGRLDSDAPKKATTDAITKLLSQLGFNADVFLGLFDDNKYVAQVAREFAQNDTGALKNGEGGIASVDTPEEGWADWALSYQGAVNDCETKEAIERLRTPKVARRMALLLTADKGLHDAIERTIRERRDALTPSKQAA